MQDGILEEKVLSDSVEIATENLDVGLIQKILRNFPEQALGLGLRIIFAILFLLVGLQVIKMLRRLMDRSLNRAGADKGVIQFLDSFLKIGLTVLLLLAIAISFGLHAATVMACLGSVGVAFALALQGSLSNCAGGVLILLVKPFVVGDYILVNGKEGNVTEIQLFYTRLQTPDGKLITMPNGVLSNSDITNFSTTGKRRLDLVIGISYDADIGKAKESLLRILEQEDRVLKDQAAEVFVSELADSAVELTARCWLEGQDYWPVRAALMEKCKLALEENKIGIPYPQVDVHMKQAGDGAGN